MEEEKRAKEEEHARQAAERAKSRQVAAVQEREEATKDLIASLPEGTSVAFELSDPSILQSVIKAISVVNEDEATFEVTEEGLSFRQMDTSHVSLLEVVIPSKACYTYVYSSKAPSVHFTVKVKEFLAMSRLVGISDRLTFVLEGDSLTCTVGEGRTHRINLYETTYQAAPLPKIEFEARATLVKTRLQKILRECTIAGEQQVTMAAQGDQLSFSGSSDFGKSEVRLKLHEFDSELLDLVVSDRQKATYSTEYLFDILKAVSVADTATIEWSAKKPLKMTLPLANVEFGAAATFWLAPRIGTEPDKEPDEGHNPTSETSQQTNETPPEGQANQPPPEPEEQAKKTRGKKTEKNGAP